MSPVAIEFLTNIIAMLTVPGSMSGEAGWVLFSHTVTHWCSHTMTSCPLQAEALALKDAMRYA